MHDAAIALGIRKLRVEFDRFIIIGKRANKLSFGEPDFTAIRPGFRKCHVQLQRLLNISQRFLIGKSFTVFVCNDRERVQQQARRLAEGGGSADWLFSLRPRERAPLDVACRVLATEWGARNLRWMVRRVSAVSDLPQEH